MNVKKYIFYFLLFLILFIFCEVILRTVTAFPLSNGSITTYDKDLQYKLKKNISKYIDSYGFRNTKNKKNNYEIAAIGDSHTFGWNAPINNSWPYLLERETNKTIYNFGTGSYSIYQYYFLAVENLKKNKKIIIHLGPSNDFFETRKFSKNSNFWVKQNKELDLKIFSNIYKDPNDNFERKLENNFVENTKLFLRDNVAIISLFDHYFWNNFLIQLKKNKKNEEYIFLSDELGYLSNSRINNLKRNIDLNEVSIKNNFQNFEKFLNKLKLLSKKNQVMFSIYPTRESLYYKYLIDQNQLINEKYSSVMTKEIEFEKLVINLIHQYGFKVVNSRNYMMEEFRKTKNKKKFFPDKDHPNYVGYQVYAKTILENIFFFN